MQATITASPFGVLPDGREATLYTLVNGSLVVKITDFGGIITELHAPDRDGRLADIVLGFDSVAPYAGDSPYFGALIGRCANRVRAGRFHLGERQFQLPVNHGGHHLHGGPGGFHKVLWQATPYRHNDAVGLRLEHRSADGEQGYPGALDVSADYRLAPDNRLLLSFAATTDRPTPVNLTQHSYFNLEAGGDILAHQLRLNAQRYLPVDATLIPTGELAPVAGTPFDFRRARRIGEQIGHDHEQLRRAGGYDHNFVLDRAAPGVATLAARVYAPRSGRVLELFTQEPGVQFYSGNFLDGKLEGKGRRYGWRSGFCLEPQHFPDSPNQPAFPGTILMPGDKYASSSSFHFSVAG
ncbi:MAG: aldose epimerase family protein [Pseudomonadota bacterium]